MLIIISIMYIRVWANNLLERGLADKLAAFSRADEFDGNCKLPWLACNAKDKINSIICYT